MEVPKKGYMSKLDVVNTCPPEAKEKKEGVKYSKAEKITYYSKGTKVNRKMNVILPPDYTTEKKYPVLYYLHGIFNNEDGLLEDGMGTIEIYNNLVKEGKAKEMIIILPDTYAPADGVGVPPSFDPEHVAGYDNFINELINDIMPYVEKHYSVAKGRENTALAGFSMGGRNTLYIGFTHPELFGYLGAFSPAPGVFPIEGEHEGLMKPEELKVKDGKEEPIVKMISVGTKDFVVTNNPETYHNALKDNNEEHIWFTVPGAMHDSDAVSAGYYNFIQYLWKNLDKEEEKEEKENEEKEEETAGPGFEFPDGPLPEWDAPVVMEVPKKGYMSKLEVVNTCPPEAKEKKEGVKYSKAEKITYYSKGTKVNRKMNVILPPDYTTEKKYPVLYYLHGIFNNEDGLLEDGMGTIEIYNNLVKEGKAKEMIIILPDTYAPADGVGVPPSFDPEHVAGYDNFINELINDIMPYVEKHYSVAKGRENTALAGFSMGGRNTLYIGFTHPELFGYLGAFSPAPGVFPIEGEHEGLMKPEELKVKDGKEEPIVKMISVGTKDFVVTNNPETYHNALKDNNEEHIWFTVPGAMHDSDAVSAGYYNFIQYLWKNLDKEEEKDDKKDDDEEVEDAEEVEDEESDEKEVEVGTEGVEEEDSMEEDTNEEDEKEEKDKEEDTDEEDEKEEKKEKDKEEDDKKEEKPDQTNGEFPETQIPDWNAPVVMEVPKKGYMSKLDVVNTCPPEAKEKKEGVKYSKAEKITYYSKGTKVNRKMNVILPPDYTTEKKYPVLYYLHGILNNEDGLLEDGMGTIEIYNNLVKEGKAKEMIIILPNTYAPADGVGVEPGFTQEHFDGYDNFINELINDIMPYVEKHYSVAKGRENTALAGFSMGGRNTLYIGFTHPELFGYLGAFSPAPGVIPTVDALTGEHKGLMKPEDLKVKDGKPEPIVKMISVGTKDFVVSANPESYHKALKDNNEEHIWFTVPGAMHDSDAVSAGYYNFIQYLWKNLDN
ncbi:alpha/beta-hydrolase [Neocallimastix californiae]|uniref:Alpha/beta-hydrolase n=1 Tax=Neocallimastix californiae TaxID=1754190 RepID=A0A1Y2F4W0_9FUNG|nr:alpha/beta-hydrolase [Neocallimastix californiae]|eukprot:ORY78707.1 alpha/beta-hydrolase [Neocallimastix californiae]